MLTQYLTRIGYAGPRQATREVLFALHRAHLISIPYENLDIHLGERLTLDFEQIFDKIVRRQRGGWCYEMNSLFAWALRQLGFEVHLLSGVVNPSSRDEYAVRDHLILLVKSVEGSNYIADVGFGNAFLYPLPFGEGVYTQGGFTFGFCRSDDGYWHFTNQQYTLVSAKKIGCCLPDDVRSRDGKKQTTSSSSICVAGSVSRNHSKNAHRD